MRRINMSEAAERLGVTLPAVSNWRRRHTSFPLVEKVAGRELVAVDDLARWLDNRTIAPKDLKASEPPGMSYGARFRRSMGLAPTYQVNGEHLWKELTKLRGTEDVATFADLVLGLLFLAVTDPDRWNDIARADGRQRMNAIELTSLDQQVFDLHRARLTFIGDPRGETRLAGVVRLVDRVRQVRDAAYLFEFLLDRFATVEGRRDAAMHTPSTVVRLIVELADPEPRSSVFDPSCESGGFLVGAAGHLARNGSRTAEASFTGHAFSERSARLARMNARLHGIPIEVDARADLIFRRGEPPTTGFDRVLTNPPFDMKGPGGAQRANFAWLRHVAASLTDDGRAGVVMPGSTLFSEATERDRLQLLDDGLIEAIIALPPQLFTTTAIPVTAWLFNRAQRERRDEILLLDASGLGHMISRTQRGMSHEDQLRIVDTVTRWRDNREYEDVPGFAVSVPVARIHENEGVLTPARYLRPTPAVEVPSLRDLRDELVQLTQKAAEADEAVARKLAEISPWIS